MKVIIKNIFIPFLIIILISSCNSISLENCNCTQLKIYGSPSDILTPIRISRENLMESEDKIISNKILIDEIIHEIQNLKEIEKMDLIDNRFVIKARCQNSSEIIVGSNNYITRIGDSCFKPSLEFLNLVSKHTKRINLKDCKSKKAELVVYKKHFQITDSLKIQSLKNELENLEPIEDDGRIIFGDTIIFNCNSNNNITVLVNDDYIKLNDQKYKSLPNLKRMLRKYEGDAHVDKVLKQALSNIDSTTNLSLRDCSLETIPTEIFGLINLESLDLSLNVIKEIPDEIYKLEKLKRLGMSYNLIEKVSPKISQLHNIENIWFLDNNLKEVPDGICKLTKLKELNITGNPIVKLPNCIPKMESLENFYFGTFSDTSHSKSILYQIENFKIINKDLHIRI